MKLDSLAKMAENLSAKHKLKSLDYEWFVSKLIDNCYFTNKPFVFAYNKNKLNNIVVVKINKNKPFSKENCALTTLYISILYKYLPKKKFSLKVKTMNKPKSDKKCNIKTGKLSENEMKELKLLFIDYNEHNWYS